MSKLTFQPVTQTDGERIILYGTGGIGKTSLALNAPAPVVFFDLDRSLGKLARNNTLGRVRTIPCATYSDVYASLNYEGWDGIKTIVIDSASELEAMAEIDVLKNVKAPGGQAKSIEDYGFGKGYRFLYDRLDLIIQALENHVRAGRNVIIICHEAIDHAPNPMGENFLRYSPDLMETKSYSFKSRVKGWADHVLFVSYDVAVKENKASGSGTRTIYTQEVPMLMAKSRTLKDPQIDYEEGSLELWEKMFPAAAPELNPVDKENK